MRPPNGRGGHEKPPKNAEHSPLSVQGVEATFVGTVHFRVLVHRDFQVTVMTVNNTKNIREGLILLFKYILVDGHGGHLQSPMYGNVPCAPDATRPPAIQRPATQQPANRRPAMQRPTTSNSQPRVPRPEGGRRPGSKSPEAGDHGARVQEGAKRQESRRLEVQRQRAESVFGQATEVWDSCCKYSKALTCCVGRTRFFCQIHSEITVSPLWKLCVTSALSVNPGPRSG